MESATPVPDSDVSQARPRRRMSPKGAFADFAESLLVTLLFALFGTTFILQAFKIPSQSMEPSLLVGDHLLVNKFIFGESGAWYEKLLPYRPVRHGDIIVFKFPYDDHPYYVKRVIGLPGDRIRIANQRVYINGDLQAEPYVVHDATFDDPFGDNFPPVGTHFPDYSLRPEWAAQIEQHIERRELVVPPDNFFVMGDNRDRSWDSRYWGFVARGAILGRPMLIYWSVEAAPEDYADRSIFGTIRGIAETLLHPGGSIRWNRMLREVH